MTDPVPPAAPDAEARDRRNRLLGRIAVIGLLLLAAIQVAPMIYSVVASHPR